jgi:hypothetical protein
MRARNGHERKYSKAERRSIGNDGKPKVCEEHDEERRKHEPSKENERACARIENVNVDRRGRNERDPKERLTEKMPERNARPARAASPLERKPRDDGYKLKPLKRPFAGNAARAPKRALAARQAIRDNLKEACERSSEDERKDRHTTHLILTHCRCKRQ